MKIAITEVKQITAKKDGATYTIVSGISKSGKTVKAFLTADQVRGVTPVPASADQLNAIFAELPTLEVEFNEEGRVESVSDSE